MSPSCISYCLKTFEKSVILSHVFRSLPQSIEANAREKGDYKATIINSNTVNT